jgi:hypothetical protein
MPGAVRDRVHLSGLGWQSNSGAGAAEGSVDHWPAGLEFAIFLPLSGFSDPDAEISRPDTGDIPERDMRGLPRVR